MLKSETAGIASRSMIALRVDKNANDAVTL